jgi:hypothetical protein
MEARASNECSGFVRPRGFLMTTILRTADAFRGLSPIVMTASLVKVPAGGSGPADLPLSVDRAPAHSHDRIALWASAPDGLRRAA